MFFNKYSICNMYIYIQENMNIYVCIHMVLMYSFRTFIYPICKIPLMNPKCLNHPLVTTEENTDRFSLQQAMNAMTLQDFQVPKRVKQPETQKMWIPAS